MRYNVCVITGSRAEYGLLKPLIGKLSNDNSINLQMVVTGSHLSRDFGNTQTEIEGSGVPIYKKIHIRLKGDSKEDMASSTGETISAFAHYFSHNKPDLLIILGDRFEIFAAVTAAAIQGIPIAHIHGGETTEGAVDEFFRHSITKMSYLHFTACEAYRKRVIQLGESPERVFNVGALGVENVINLPVIARDSLQEILEFDLSGDYSIVTYHSVTQENCTEKEQLYELINAMDALSGMKYIITKANADAGGRIINSIWDEESKSRNTWKVVASLGAQTYLSALKGARMMIGNSSSGIIEAPAIPIPTVNIGDRQKGRMMAQSVICCKPRTDSILVAMRQAISKEFSDLVKHIISPFGTGNTSQLITERINAFLKCGAVDMKKSFYDVMFEV